MFSRKLSPRVVYSPQYFASSFLANFCTATIDMGMSGTQHSKMMADRACTPTSSTNRVTGASRLYTSWGRYLAK